MESNYKILLNNKADKHIELPSSKKYEGKIISTKGNNISIIKYNL